MMDSKIKDYCFVKVSEKDAKKLICSMAAVIISGIAVIVLALPVLYYFMELSFDIVSILFFIGSILVFVISVVLLITFLAWHEEILDRNEGFQCDDWHNLFFPKNVRIFNQCVDFFTKNNIQYVSLHELKSAVPECVRMDNESFRNRITSMCNEKYVINGIMLYNGHHWFKRGQVIGNVLCVSDSAVEYISERLEQERMEREAASSKAEDAYQKKEKELVAQNVFPETYDCPVEG